MGPGIKFHSEEAVQMRKENARIRKEKMKILRDRANAEKRELAKIKKKEKLQKIAKLKKEIKKSFNTKGIVVTQVSTKIARREISYTPPSLDFLKFFGVAKTFLMDKLNINEKEIEILLRIYSEPFFTKKEYERMKKACNYRSMPTIESFIKKGFVCKHIQKNTSNVIYNITPQTKVHLENFYNKLKGTSPYSQDPSNKFAKPNASEKEKYVFEEMKASNTYHIHEKERRRLEPK